MQSEIKNAVETVFSTSMEEYEARKSAMAVLEAANWHCTPETFKQYYTAGLTLTPDEVNSWIEREPVFFYYEAAWDKIRKEVETVQPDADSVILWHVYNMGYIIKTAETCFAVDLHHRRSEELIDKLEVFFNNLLQEKGKGEILTSADKTAIVNSLIIKLKDKVAEAPEMFNVDYVYEMLSPCADIDEAKEKITTIFDLMRRLIRAGMFD